MCWHHSNFFRRKPFELKYALLIYNLAIALLNLYIASELLVASISLKYNYLCQPYKPIFSQGELRVSLTTVIFFVR